MFTEHEHILAQCYAEHILEPCYTEHEPILSHEHILALCLLNMKLYLHHVYRTSTYTCTIFTEHEHILALCLQNIQHILAICLQKGNIHVYLHYVYSTCTYTCFRLCNWLSFRCLVPWINNLPLYGSQIWYLFKFRWSMSLT